MSTAIVVRHLAFEDLGSFGRVLEARGVNARYLEAGVDRIDTIDPTEAELLIVLGGPIGVYQEESYPFLAAEIQLLQKRLQADLPTLGICLGAQLIARALGAAVYPGGEKEIGWSRLELTEEGAEGPLAALGPEHTAVLHWHGDTFDLPAGAVRLASTQAYPNQAFAWKRRGLALQFHPEVTVRGMERWFIGHTGEIHATAGISVARLREDAREYGPALERCGRAFFSDWLDEVLGF